MIEELNKVIADYVQAQNTDYAIMINGKWGCGKSYYIEHALDKMINSIPIPQNKRKEEPENTEQKTYKKAYVSLYGITNVDEFHLRVAYGLNPIMANKWVKAVGSIASKTAAFFNVDIGVKDKSNLEFGLDSHVLVFDDLERTSPELSVIDVMGWINSYVEHQKCKVIIVCNEHTIEKQSILNNDNRYQNYLENKEKTVRFSYAYESDVEKVYSALIAKKLVEEKAFYESYKGLVLELFNQGGEKNLRTLIFIIDCLYQVCQPAKDQQADETIMRNLITTFVIYAMEHKKGATRDQMNAIVKEELQLSNFQLDLGEPGPEVMGNDDEETMEEKPQEKPWKSSIDSNYIAQMYRMPELVDYIITGDLNQAELRKSIDRQVAEFKKQQDTPQGELIKELRDFANLSDDEFLGKIAQLRAYIEGDLYNLYELLDVYTVLNKFHYFQIQGFKITPEWDKMFMDACDKAAETHVYDHRFELCVPMWDPSDDSEEGKHYNRLKAYAVQWNNRCEQKDGKEDAEKYIQAVDANDIETLRAYRKREDTLSLVYNMDWEKLWKLIISLKTTNPVACAAIDNVEYWVVKYGSNPEMWKPLLKMVTKYLDKESEKNAIRVMFLYPLMSSLTERVLGRQYARK
ncbi:MAG: hypothetical protein IJQ84_04790 [Paludibacteraceae bacterium]|nr:hypothetical protein [Paludibacteraceae bacterium]